MSVLSKVRETIVGWCLAIGQKPAYLWWIYCVSLLTLCSYVLVRTPIIASDNDLWYHLSHGRFIFETGQIPDTSYFSFISPARSWTDYYWLFQAAVYSIFGVGGYFGLLIWRSVVYAGFLAIVARFLFSWHRVSTKNQATAPVQPQLICLGLVFGLMIVHSLPKFLLVRPHAASFLFLAIFLYILEFKPEKSWLLPLVAVAWTNIHGIEYPVLLLVCLAYFLEGWIAKLRDLRRTSATKMSSAATARRDLFIALSMAMVFVTPNGRDLIAVPFVSTEYASSYIGEHSQLSPEEFFSYRLSTEGMDSMGAFNLLLLMALLGALGEAVRGRLRPSHLLMLGGGLFLLTKAVRLSHECALLALPLIASCAGSLGSLRWPKTARPVLVALGLLALAPPYLVLGNRLPQWQQRYPLSLQNLPHGIANFLNHVDASGRVMNNPNVGGYLQWALKPGYEIFMDLEIPFLFADEDIFEIGSSFFDPEALRQFLDHYHPDFIAATLASTQFGTLISAHPEYVPVFFDDQAVLYVDSGSYPEIAGSFALRRADPYTLSGQRFSALTRAERHEFLYDLDRIDAIDSEISSVNQAAAILHNLDGDYQRGLEHAQRLVTRDPKLARGHAFVGDALLGLDQPADAVAAYQRGLRWTHYDNERRSVQKSLSLAFSRSGRNSDAYTALRSSVGKLNIEASPIDLFRLGVLAAAAKEPHDAIKMFEFALVKTPLSDTDLRRQIEENLATLKAQ